MISYGLHKGHTCRPVRLPKSYGPGSLVGITWCCGHMHGRSMGYLRVLWSRSCKIPYVYLTGSVRFRSGHPKGPYGFHTDMGTSVHSVVRESYGPARKPCGLGNTRTINGAGPYGVRWGPRVHGRVIDYVTFDPLGPGRLLTGLLWAPTHW